MRLCAKSRESVNTSVDFLTLHNLVASLAQEKKDDLHKLILLKNDVVCDGLVFFFIVL